MITKEQFDSLSTGEGTTPEDWVRLLRGAFVHNSVCLGSACLVKGPCELRKGVFKGGVFHGGVFDGGEFHGGLFHGGVFHGGVFHDGVFHDGVFHGGSFHDGVFHNGVFYGGVYQGGEFHSGAFHEGLYKVGEFDGGVFYKSPMTVWPSLPWACVGNSTMVSVGCEVHTPQYWIDNIDRIADKHGVSKENRQMVLKVVKFISEF